MLKNIDLTLDFIKKRQKKEGGFGASEELPATIQDTFFAVNSLRILGIDVDKDRLCEFIQNKISEFKNNAFLLDISIKLKYDYCDEMNLNIDLIELISKKNNKLQEIASISDILRFTGKSHYILPLKDKILDEITSDLILEDIFYCFVILGGERFPQKFISHIISCQNSDGGFGFKPNTTSFMENAYYAIKILEYFNKKPLNMELLHGFVTSCQRMDGGFARASGGASFLESTYHALYILKFIQNNKN